MSKRKRKRGRAQRFNPRTKKGRPTPARDWAFGILILVAVAVVWIFLQPLCRAAVAAPWSR